jgi:aminomethyltransferase
MLKKTPLHDIHRKSGGKLIEFGGWEMPVHYTGIIDEHHAVRNAAGMFDISHMGEVYISGACAEAFLNHVLTNDIRKLTPGLGQYTLMCNERGGVVDDLYAYRLAANLYLLIINASRIDPDVAWLEKRLAEFPGRNEVTLKNASDDMAAVAVQGPNVKQFIDKLFGNPPHGGTPVPRASSLAKNQVGIWSWGEENGKPLDCYVSRTGYTGEDGFEIVVSASQAESLWKAVMEAGAGHGLKPAGLGARDTLRTEVCYPLYGHELNENTSPMEAGVGFFVALDKREFIGRPVLMEQRASGTARKCVAFKMTDKSAPPRPGYTIHIPGDASGPVGEVVSGTQSPSLAVGIGMGYVKTEFAKADKPIEIEIRGKRSPAVIVSKPIFRKAG